MPYPPDICRYFSIKLLILALLAVVLASCNLLKGNSQRKVEKKQAQSEKQAEKAFEDFRKEHLKKQSKETLRMMKRTKKDARKHNHYMKKKGFLKGSKCR